MVQKFKRPRAASGSSNVQKFKAPDGKSSNRWKPKLPRSAMVAVVFLAKLDVNRKVGKL